MPLYRSVPKFGFKNIDREEFKAINLDALDELAKKTSTSVIDSKVLLENGLMSKNDKIKILGRGEIKAKVEIKAHAFSASAIAAIEKAGGKATVVS
jgi:large subunit ribosomal protein L15